MSGRVRIATGDQVEIIDSSSPDYGKKGMVTDIKSIPVTMIDLASKPLTRSEEFVLTVKIGGVDKQFKTKQIKKVD